MSRRRRDRSGEAGRGAFSLVEILVALGIVLVLTGMVAGVFQGPVEQAKQQVLAANLRSTALQAIFGGLAIIVGLYMALGRAHWRIGPVMPVGPVRWALSPLLGFLSVLMGIGGGSFGVPVMSLYGVPIHRAVATAAGFGVIIAVPSVAVFLFTPLEVAPPLSLGAVNLVAFGLVIAMTLITAPWGAALAHRMDAKPLKRVFGIFLCLVALNMIRKAAGW